MTIQSYIDATSHVLDESSQLNLIQIYLNNHAIKADSKLVLRCNEEDMDNVINKIISVSHVGDSIIVASCTILGRGVDEVINTLKEALIRSLTVVLADEDISISNNYSATEMLGLIHSISKKKKRSK